MKGRLNRFLVFFIIMIVCIVVPTLADDNLGELGGDCYERPIFQTTKFPGSEIQLTSTIDKSFDGFNLSQIEVTYPRNTEVIFDSDNGEQINSTDDLSSFTYTTDFFELEGGTTYALTNVSYTNASNPADVRYACSLLPIEQPSANITGLLQTIFTIIAVFGAILFFMTMLQTQKISVNLVVSTLIFTILIIAIINTAISLFFG